MPGFQKLEPEQDKQTDIQAERITMPHLWVVKVCCWVRRKSRRSQTKRRTDSHTEWTGNNVGVIAKTTINAETEAAYLAPAVFNRCTKRGIECKEKEW